jgi:hypothetical protein
MFRQEYAGRALVDEDERGAVRGGGQQYSEETAKNAE